MGYKSEADITLDRINQYTGVSNDIFVYNSSDQTSCNIEMQKVARETIMDICATGS